MRRTAAVMLVVTLVTGPTVSVHAQDATQSPPAAPERMREDMMAMRKQMMAEEQAANARLQALLERLAGAEGDARIDAITALLRELTEQKMAHQRHMEHMMTMMEQMMGGMMGGGMRGRGAPAPAQP
jgi:hypothetical protein